MLAISPTTNTSHLIIQQKPAYDAYLWLNYFDPAAAVDAVADHIETLPGSRYERHTMRAYMTSLADFLRFMGAYVEHQGADAYRMSFNAMRQPLKAEIAAYMADCARRGLSSATITRYMAAVRHFLRALEEQPVTPGSGADFFFITEAMRQFRMAASVKNPKPDRTSNRPALEQHGTRLTLAQVNSLFAQFEGTMHLLSSKRDLALLYLAVTSGLRAAELARITLNAITPGDGCFEVRVRGKRSNIDPIGIDAEAYSLIAAYVDAWNARLESDDPRRIEGDTPVFQQIIHGDHIPAYGSRGFDPQRGISPRAILMIVERRAAAGLGRPIGAHDLRRTCAYLMRQHGFEWDEIRAQLRHKSIGTTEKYVGRQLDLSKALLSNRVDLIVPAPVDQLPLP